MDILQNGMRVRVTPTSAFNVKKPYTGTIIFYNELAIPNPKYTVLFDSPIKSSNSYKSSMNRLYYGMNTNGEDFESISTYDFERSQIKPISGGTRRARRNRKNKRKSRRN